MVKKSQKQHRNEACKLIYHVKSFNQLPSATGVHQLRTSNMATRGHVTLPGKALLPPVIIKSVKKTNKQKKMPQLLHLS